MYLTVRHPSPGAIFTGMLLALIALSLSAVCVTQPLVQATITRSADPSSPISLRFYAKYVCVTLSSTSKPCVTYDSAELSGYSCCGQSALYKAAGAVGFLAIACEVCGLILACCGTIKIKPTTVSLFGGVVYCVAAVAHLSIVCFLVNSGAYHSSEWVLPLSLSSVTSRHVGVGLIANCIAVPFDFFAAAVFFIAPVACGKTMHIGMPDQAFSGINVHHNPMKGSRSGSIASRFGLGSTANSSANSNGLITSPYAGSGPPSTMTQDSFSLTGFVSSGNAEFSISIPKQSSSAKQREGSIVSPAPSRGDRVALEAKRATQADAGRRS